MGQILPVTKGLGPVETVDHCISRWNLWRERRSLRLPKDMRAAADPEYAEWVASVRDGSANVGNSDDIMIPDSLLVEVDAADRPPRKKQKKSSAYSSTDEEVQLMNKLVDTVSFQ